jgi:glycosyltransferase involved in cell wall biosynthesis
MRVAVLAHSLRFGGGLAVGQGVLGALGRIAPELTLLAAIPADVGYENIVAAHPGAEAIVYRRGFGAIGRWAYDELVLTSRVRRFRPHVILALNGRGLTRAPAPQVLFPQNAFLYYPRRFYGDMPAWMAWREGAKSRDLGRQLRRCALALAQTTVVAARLRDVLGYRGPTLVCGSAVGNDVLDAPAGPRPSAMGVEGGDLVLFYPATYSPHKNLEVILDAFERGATSLEGVRVLTTLDRTQHPLAGRFLDRLDRSRARDRIVNVGPIARGDLARYYAHGDGLLMPSLIETVGLPYLEAMHFGKPILTSDLDFAHEVCGDAAIYFDPFDAASVRNAIVSFRDDLGLRSAIASRSQARGLRHRTTWDEVARVIVDGLVSVAAS